MPNMNQKVIEFLNEQKEFITDECINILITLYERGHTNISFLAESINLKQHRMTPIIAVIEAFGFVELYKAGQSKEYNITDFGIEFLKHHDLLQEKQKKQIPTVLESQEQSDLIDESIPRIFRLISIGKRNSIEEIAQTIQIENKVAKETLQQLTLASMVENTFKNRVRRYKLTNLGELYYYFIRKNENGKEVLQALKTEVPRLYDTLVEIATNGIILYESEFAFAETLGLAYSDNTSVFLSEQGKLLLENKK